MKNIHYLILLVIFLTGSFLRISPVTQFDNPLKYDSYYHIRVVELIKDTGTVPMYEPWPYEGRPHIYPPLYHLIIFSISAITSISIVDVIRFFLPIISSLTILVTFWLVQSFSTKNAALFASLFMALNPYLITGSYDSPQVIGLMLSLLAVYFLLNKKYLYCSLVLAPIFLVNTFSALMISLPIFIYLLVTKQAKAIPTVFIFSIALFLIWYLPRLNLLYCSDNSLGTFFIGKAIGGAEGQHAMITLIPLLASFALINKVKGQLFKFYLIWVLIFAALIFSFIFTYAFQPWRQSIYLSFGFSIFLALILDNLGRLKKLIFLLLFTSLFLFSIFFFINYLGLELSPPLSTQEYMLIDWAGRNLPDSSIPLAHHDVCAGLMTLTNKTCVLDISFECIQNKTAFYNYENFFWLENPVEIQNFLRAQPITHILYRPSQFNEKALEQTEVNKIYSSWSCIEETCDRSAIVYEKIQLKPSIVVRVDDIWAITNNGLQEWGYTYPNLNKTLSILKKHNLSVVLSVTPSIFDSTANKTISIESDSMLIGIIKDAGYTIALHGATHNCPTATACEFDGLSLNEDIALLNSSKHQLESALDESVLFFVPPKDSMDANLSLALKAVGLRELEENVYDPIAEWNWENRTVSWKGFGDFALSSGANVIEIHYNTLTDERLAELDFFLSSYENS